MSVGFTSCWLLSCSFCRVKSFLFYGKITGRYSFFFCSVLWGILFGKFHYPLLLHPYCLCRHGGVKKVSVGCLDGSSLSLSCLSAQIIQVQNAAACISLYPGNIFFVTFVWIHATYLNWSPFWLCLCLGLNCVSPLPHKFICWSPNTHYLR